MTEGSVPTASLMLEWVFGYRGHQCRNNLVYNKTGKLVYFVAGVGIVFDPLAKKQNFFLGHRDDIISLALHPNEILVATGQVGKSPFICVWNSESLEDVSILKDAHTHGVTCLAFSGDGERLVSIGSDQSNTLCLWEWKKGKIIATTRGHSDRIFDAQFCPGKGQFLMVTCGIKHIKFWSHSGGNTLSSKKGIFGKTGEIQTMMCLAFPAENRVGGAIVTYSSTMSGDIYIWNDNQLARAVKEAHTGAIYSLTNHENGFITGGKDGMLQMWDKDLQPRRTYDLTKALSIGQEGLIIRSLDSKGSKKILIGTVDSQIIEFIVNADNNEKSFAVLMEGHSEGELWALAVHGNIFATGSDDKTVRIWSLKTNSTVSKRSMENGIRSCSFNYDGSSLSVGMLNGSFAVMKTSDLKVQKVIRDRREVIHEMKYSPDGRYLAVGCNDNFVDVYDADEDYKKVGVCTGNSSFVTHLDWSSDGKYIVTNSGASERLIYAMPGGKRVTNVEEIKSISWYTFTGVLGDEVKGIWAKYSDVTDINATDVRGKVMVTADDFGLVKLFSFPCFKKGANHKKYVGHSAHVTNCRFTGDKSSVLSIGGADHSIFKWNYMPGEGDDLVGSGVDGLPGSARSLKSGTPRSARSLRQSLPQKIGYSGDSISGDDCSSDISSVPLDSDVERENEKNYERLLSKQEVLDIQKKARKRSTKLKPKEASDLLSPRSQSANEKKGPPDASLRLTYAHGYRGFDCRNNLFYLPCTPDVVVYHTAAVGVVLNKRQRSQRFYVGHGDDILSLAVHPAKDIVATGEVGKNPTIHVWEVESLKTLSILKDEHRRGSVLVTSQVGDGKKLATVGLDDDHYIVVWNWRKGEKLASARGYKDKIYMIKWNTHEPDNLVTVGNKLIKFWSQTGNGFSSKRGLFGKVSNIETMLCVAYGKNSKQCFSGSVSGLVHCWVETTLVRVVQAHQGPVFAIYSLDGNSFYTGGKDGLVNQWNDSFKEKLSTLKVDLGKDPNSMTTVTKETRPIVIKSVATSNLERGLVLVGTRDSEVVELDDKTGSSTILNQGHGEGELWGLAIHPSKPFFATVSDDCTLRIWTFGSHNQLVAAKHLGKPSRAVSFSHDGRLLAVGSRDGSFVVLETSTLAEKVKVNRRKENISDIKFSPDPGKYLAVASHDNFVDIYNVATCQHVGVCKGASSYITHLDWDSFGKLLMINSGAHEVLFFEAPKGLRQVPTSGEVDRMTWHTWTGVLGPKCEGIWPPSSDITDVNSAHSTKDGKLLATGDDFGFVKLFDFPARSKHAKYKKYIGHSAHVTNVRWSHDDQSLISVGGGDASILIWSQVGNSVIHSENRSVQERIRSSRESLNLSEVRTSREMSAQEFGSTNSLAPNQGQMESEESDSDDDDAGTGGYDSDVQREADLDYTARFNLDPLRDKPSVIGQNDTIADSIESGITRMESIRMMCSRKVQKSKLGHQARGILLAGMSKDYSISGLNLVAILGYRGFDCRNNVQYLEDSEVVYHTAGAAVVFDLKTGKQRFYLGHRDDIISLTVNKNPKFKGLVATGEIGPKPTIHIWDSKSMAASSILIGSIAKGVGSLSFSCSGKLLLALGVDEAHTIVVFNWLEGVQLAKESGSSQRIFHTEYRPDSDSSFVSVGIGHIKFWSLAGSALISRSGGTASYRKTNPISKKITYLSLAFGTNNVTYSGSITGNIFVWKDGVLTRVVMAAHDGPIFTMFTTLTDGLVVSGAKDKNRDGQVKLWDQELKRSKQFKIPVSREAEFVVVKSVSRIRGRIVIGTKDSRLLEINEKTSEVREVASYHGDGELWGLSSHPTQRSFVTSSDDGYLKIWALDTGLIASHYIGPSRAVHHSNKGNWLVVGLNNGSFVVISTASYKCITKKRDRGSMVTVVKFTPEDAHIVVATQEKFIDVYELIGDKGQEVMNLKRSTIINLQDSMAISLDCSKDGRVIRVGTDRLENKYYNIITGSETAGSEVEFISWTSVSGPELKGAWPKGGSPDHVNCAAQSNDGRSLVTGDDFGLIKLFRFPATNGEMSRYIGHSAHVTNIMFSTDDSHVVSTGGDDSSIFIWQCI